MTVHCRGSDVSISTKYKGIWHNSFRLICPSFLILIFGPVLQGSLSLVKPGNKRQYKDIVSFNIRANHSDREICIVNSWWKKRSFNPFPTTQSYCLFHDLSSFFLGGWGAVHKYYYAFWGNGNAYFTLTYNCIPIKSHSV